MANTKNAGDRYTEEIFKEVSHQAIVFSQNLDIGWPMYHHSGTVNLRILAWIFFYQYSSIFEEKKVGMDLTKEEALGGLTTSKPFSSRISRSI